MHPELYEPETATVAPLSQEMVGRRGSSRVRLVLSYALAPIIYLLRRLFSARYTGVDRDRDELETELLDRAMREGLPVLGICRGAQLMNVYVGGRLLRELTSFYAESPNPWTVFPRKRIHVKPSSRLHSILGREVLKVNSLHRQAVDELATCLSVVAQEFNGVVQAVEYDEHPFFVGVQWHPEYLPQRPEQRRIFRCFVAAAKAAKPSSSQRLAEDPS